MDNLETLATLGTQDRTKLNKTKTYIIIQKLINKGNVKRGVSPRLTI